MIAIRVLALLDFLIVLVLCKNSTDVQTTTTSWPNRQILSDDILKQEKRLKRHENIIDDEDEDQLITLDKTSINNIEENTRIKYYLNGMDLSEQSSSQIMDEQILHSNQIISEEGTDNLKQHFGFMQHPQDVLITGKLPVLVQCLVKNSAQAYLECNNKIRDDVKKNVTRKADIKYEMLTLFVKRKDVEINTKGSINRKLVCKCVAFSANNEKIISKKAVIKTAYIEEEFQSEPMDEISYEGETVEMRCDPPKGEPIPNVYWLKDSKEIDTHSDSSRFKLSNDFSLLILASRKSDSGNYVCVASNLVDKRLSKPAKLTLLDSSKKYTWSEWSNWSECSSPCGPGITKRIRTCQTTNKMAQIQNVSISMCGEGASFEEKQCQIMPCLKQPGWSEWSAWSACNQDCKQYRRRYCENESINPDSSQTFSLDKSIQNEFKTKSCIGDKVMIRFCNNSLKTCNLNKHTNHHRHHNQQSQEINELNFLKSSTTSIPKQSDILHSIQSSKSPESDFKIDQTFLKLGIGLSGSILLASLFILLIILVFVLKRNKSRKNRSELNLYYTCEKQMPPDDECSIFKFSKASSTTASSASSSSGSSAFKSRFKKPDNSEQLNHRIFPETNQNRLLEQQLLLGNVPQQYQLVQNNSNNSYLINPQNYLNLSSPFRPINQSNASSSLSSSGSSNHKNTTTTTVHLSSSPSSNIYYAAPITQNTALDESNYNYNELILKQNNNEKIIMRKIHEQDSNYLNYANQSLSYQQQLAHLQQIKNKQDEELAYDIADPITNASNEVYKQNQVIPLSNMELSDVCLGQVGTQGARLTLDCGISLLIPEGAISAEQKVFVYLGVCRNESFKPKLNDRNTFLSEIIQIGPSNLILLKPVVLSINHCAHKVTQDWSVNVFSSFNSFERAPDWIEEQNLTSENNTNLNMYLNSTENSFVLITEKLGRYCLTGESRSSKQQPTASKYYRLVTFCSSSITNNEFNLRIYCIDNLLVALQEVLRDENKIGGTLLDSSEAFLISHSNINDSITICIDDLNKTYFNCKYNVNCQDIPLSHIWNGRNHLLHCSFTLEKNNDHLVHEQEFTCKIRASFQSNKEQLVSIKINYNLKQQLSCIERGLKNWNLEPSASLYLNSWSQLTKPQNLIKTYFKIDKNLKKQISTILDDSYINEKNWRALANKLEINRNLHYFASKASPTEMLLLYFEAISDLKCHDLIRLNNDLIKCSTVAVTDQYSSPQEQLFREIFLNYIL